MKLANEFRRQLAFAGISWQLTLLGIVTGIVASAAILLFRWTVEGLQLVHLDTPDEFTSLNELERLLLPMAGALILVMILRKTARQYHRMGIPYVLHRLRRFYGYMPLGTTINQFFSATAALAFGFSVGREGPAVHLGAGSASYLAQRLNLPDNSHRTLAACGIAAGISASFNSPLAAVVFVLEVVLQQYRIHQFLPIMLSSLIGAAMSQLAFGNIHQYSDIVVPKLGATELAPLLLLGLAVGLVAVLFNRSLLTVIKYSSRYSLMLRLPLAAVILGLVGWQIPHAMGTEDGALTLALSTNPELSLLLVVFIGKLITTISALGLGIPGGVIGVLYGIGALLGSLLLWSLVPFFPELAQYSHMVALICMVAMMATSLNAPLAAMVAMLELSQNTAIILPSLLVVIPAILLSQQVFKLQSLFFDQLDIQQLPYRVSPVLRPLQDTGVMTLMRRKFILQHDDTDWQQIDSTLPLVIRRPDDSPGDTPPTFLMPSGQLGYSGMAETLIEVPAMPDHSTLAEVYQRLSLRRRGTVVLYDRRTREAVGVINWRALRKHLHKEQL